MFNAHQQVSDIIDLQRRLNRCEYKLNWRLPPFSIFHQIMMFPSKDTQEWSQIFFEELVDFVPMKTKIKIAKHIITLIYGAEKANSAENEWFNRPEKIIIPSSEFTYDRICISKLLYILNLASTHKPTLKEVGDVYIDGKQVIDINQFILVTDGMIVRANKKEVMIIVNDDSHCESNALSQTEA